MYTHLATTEDHSPSVKQGQHTTMGDVTVPPNLWTKSVKNMVKVVLSGQGAAFLPTDAFVGALFDHGVVRENNLKNISITIPHNKRKRYLYGDVSFKHRQSFTISYENENIQFLLIDPCDKRHQVTLLHMPIETTREAVTYIFTTFGCDTSDISIAPGSEFRHDRWQLLVDRKDIEKVPDNFVLPNMGPEGENLRIKVFLEGRKPSTSLKQNVENHMNTQEQTTTNQARSASLEDFPRQTAPSIPINQPPPPTFTPTTRPRPTPSPNEEQPFLKRIRPENNSKSVPGEFDQSMLETIMSNIQATSKDLSPTSEQTNDQMKSNKDESHRERQQRSDAVKQRNAAEGGDRRHRNQQEMPKSAGDRATDWREANRRQY